jgi:hypothetical protein
VAIRPLTSTADTTDSVFDSDEEGRRWIAESFFDSFGSKVWLSFFKSVVSSINIFFSRKEPQKLHLKNNNNINICTR